jgi:hypothetical protein
VLVKVGGERKDPAISRLQKSHDTVHEPVMVPLPRIDLCHHSTSCFLSPAPHCSLAARGHVARSHSILTGQV